MRTQKTEEREMLTVAVAVIVIVDVVVVVVDVVVVVVGHQGRKTFFPISSSSKFFSPLR